MVSADPLVADPSPSAIGEPQQGRVGHVFGLAGREVVSEHDGRAAQAAHYSEFRVRPYGHLDRDITVPREPKKS